LFDASGELMMRAPGILSLHATTFTNALHYSWVRCHNEETRKLLLLQNAAFLPLFRGNSRDSGPEIDALEPAPLAAEGAGAVEEIFSDMSRDRLLAARKIVTYLKGGGDSGELARTARRLIFQKGTNSHDYKYSSALLEDYQAMRPPWREQFLASGAFYLKGAGDADNRLVGRVQAALS
jgi:hypothetical protein